MYFTCRREICTYTNPGYEFKITFSILILQQVIYSLLCLITMLHSSSWTNSPNNTHSDLSHTYCTIQQLCFFSAWRLRVFIFSCYSGLLWDLSNTHLTVISPGHFDQSLIRHITYNNAGKWKKNTIFFQFLQYDNRGVQFLFWMVPNSGFSVNHCNTVIFIFIHGSEWLQHKDSTFILSSSFAWGCVLSCGSVVGPWLVLLN